MRKATTKTIIKDWLKDRILNNRKVIKSHEFETELVKYGSMYWGVKKLPSAYSRAWRSIRSDKDYDGIGIENVQELKTKDNQGVWELVTSI